MGATEGDGASERDELAERVHSLAIRVLRRVRPVDAASGLSAARLSALSVLVFGGARTVGELAAAEQVTVPTMSRLVSGLSSEGLVTRGSDPADGRRVRVSATRAGVAALEAGRSRRVSELSAVLSSVGDRDRRTVLSAAEILEAALRES